ncbi:MAG: ribosomal RNA small subunit methyltransferase A [Parcubacteria group bacterium]|nr:ribosomal RNA small subunit methyltransferase A [Parcubacteria group bacterium]
MMKTKAKPLGQYFLSDPKIAEKIAGALEIQRGDAIIEIGPGEGFLTRELIKRSGTSGIKIVAIEKDGRLAEELRRRLAAERIRNVEIVSGDALKILPLIPNRYPPSANRYKIVGNIPYYITGKLLRIIGDLSRKPALAVLMVQKEVAERICAKPPKMNLLAAAVQFWAEAEIVAFVPKKHFRPQPKVDSAIIALVVKKEGATARERECYYKFIKAAFKQPRKTLANNLAENFKMKKLRIAEIMTKNGLPPSVRPQNIDLKTALKLSKDFI